MTTSPIDHIAARKLAQRWMVSSRSDGLTHEELFIVITSYLDLERATLERAVDAVIKCQLGMNESATIHRAVTTIRALDLSDGRKP